MFCICYKFAYTDSSKECRPVYFLLYTYLYVKQFPNLPHYILRALYKMSNRPLVLVKLEIVSPFIYLVPEEMNLFINNPTPVFFSLYMPQIIGLIPPDGKSIETSLPTDCVLQFQV